MSKIFCYELASEDGIVLSNWVEDQGLCDVIDFVIRGRSCAFQHKEGAYGYGENTDG